MSKTYITQINGKWYAYEAVEQTDEVYSIGNDNPYKARWFAKWNKSGVVFVATPSPNRDAARKKARRFGEYGGAVAL